MPRNESLSVIIVEAVIPMAGRAVAPFQMAGPAVTAFFIAVMPYIVTEPGACIVIRSVPAMGEVVVTQGDGKARYGNDYICIAVMMPAVVVPVGMARRGTCHTDRGAGNGSQNPSFYICG